MQTISDIVPKEVAESEAAKSRWPLPFNISLEKLDLITKAYFQAGADQQPVLAADLSKTTALNPTTLKANSKFLASIGILQQTDNHLYSLTADGTVYVKALSSGDTIERASIIKNIVRHS